MPQKTKKISLIIIIVIILALFINIVFLNSKRVPKLNKDEAPAQISFDKTKEENKNKTIFFKTENLEFEYQDLKAISVYQFMEKLKNEGKLTFKSKNYIGMGEFIQEINNIKNGEKNWIYYINKEKANIGVSNYQINKGDMVSWKYE